MVAGLMTAVATPAGAFGSSSAPPSPPSVNAGGYMTCGVQPNLTAACWGDNLSEGPGQAQAPADVKFLEVNAGYNTACGVTVLRSITCWGSNSNSKVTNVPPGTFTHVAPGFNFVCALRTDGHPVCWGSDDASQVSNTPVNEVFRELTVGIRHACGMRFNGSVRCWGANADGQLNVPEPTFLSINSGNFTVCGIRPDRSITCWGRNNGGQLTEPAGTFVQVSAGFAHVCALRSDRTMACWGRNAEGQAVAAPGTFVNVSAGTFHSCAMPVAGPPALCWGNNAAGRVQPNLNPTAPPPGITAQPFSFQLTMGTHVSPAPTFKLVSGSLPAGVTLSPAGLISGTPTESGAFPITVSAANALSPPDCPRGATGDLACTPGNPSTRTATRNYVLTISPAP
jgi:alpha-tubulin suppressor-like RCC1 family protein